MHKTRCSVLVLPSSLLPCRQSECSMCCQILQVLSQGGHGYWHCLPIVQQSREVCTDCLDCLSPSSRQFIWSCSSGFGVELAFASFACVAMTKNYCSLCDRFQFCMACVNTEFLRHCDHCDMILCAFCQKIHRDREGSHNRQGEGSKRFSYPIKP